MSLHETIRRQGNIFCGNFLGVDKAIRECLREFKESNISHEYFFHMTLSPADLGGMNYADIRNYIGGLWDVHQDVPLDGNDTFNPVYDTQQLTGLGIVRLEGFNRGNKWIIAGFNRQSNIVWINLELIAD